MKKKEKSRNIVIFLITMCLIIITIYNIYVMYQNIEIADEYDTKKVSLSTNYGTNVDNSITNVKSTADMLEEVNKSVVGISKLTSVGGSILNNNSSDELGLGTGIIVSENGYILSNCHVTGEKYSSCYITIDENTYNGTVVWSDKNIDLAIVKIQANSLSYITLGNSSSIRVGDSVFAIGNPIGYEFRRTVTSGIISALNRTIKLEENENINYVSDLIQTDATINPGNSGGPLVNKNGEVIGINTVKITSAEGIGFAVPINVVKPVIEAYLRDGNFEEASLGIYAYDGDVAEYLKVKDKLHSGVYVSKVLKNSPALKAGVQDGDLIVSIDGKNLNTIYDLREYIYSKKPRDVVNLSIVRGKNSRVVEVVLERK